MSFAIQQISIPTADLLPYYTHPKGSVLAVNMVKSRYNKISPQQKMFVGNCWPSGIIQPKSCKGKSLL